MEANQQRFPRAILQRENFSRGAAFTVLERSRKVGPSFRGSIQGTGAAVLSRVVNACQIKEGAPA